MKKMYCNEPIEKLYYAANFDDILCLAPWSNTEQWHSQDFLERGSSMNVCLDYELHYMEYKNGLLKPSYNTCCVHLQYLADSYSLLRIYAGS